MGKISNGFHINAIFTQQNDVQVTTYQKQLIRRGNEGSVEITNNKTMIDLV